MFKGGNWSNEIPKAEAYERRASEIQFVKPINSKKNNKQNKYASHGGKGENKLTFVEPILLPSFQNTTKSSLLFFR